MSEKVKSYLANIADFKPDPENSNRHTIRGQSVVKKGMEQRGYARPAFAAQDGTVLGGNLSTMEVAVDIGLGDGKVFVIETDGTIPIIHKRIDVAPGSKEAKLLAIEDNRSAELSLDWSPLQLAADLEAGLDLDDLFDPLELSKILEKAAIEFTGDGSGANDPRAEWQGMPEFNQEDSLGEIASVKVHFATLEDIEQFSKLVGQSVTEDTTYIWFPKQKRENLKVYQVVDES